MSRTTPTCRLSTLPGAASRCSISLLTALSEVRCSLLYVVPPSVVPVVASSPSGPTTPPVSPAVVPSGVVYVSVITESVSGVASGSVK